MLIVLASGSPRRRELLALLGVRFRIRPAGIPERPRRGECPEETAVRLAREKALAAALSLSARERSRAVLLGADTIVAAGDRALGKPRDARDARRMLRLLSGRTHRVVTGVAVWSGRTGRMLAGRRVSRVTFSRLRPDQIDRYVASGEPMDVAGAYAIQGGAAAFVARVSGSVTNVVGLPMDLTATLLARAGVKGLV